MVKINMHLGNVKVAMSSNSQARALKKNWRAQPERVEAVPKCASKCFCSCSQRGHCHSCTDLTLEGHKVLVKRHHRFWVAASVVARVGEIAGS